MLSHAYNNKERVVVMFRKQNTKNCKPLIDIPLLRGAWRSFAEKDQILGRTGPAAIREQL